MKPVGVSTYARMRHASFVHVLLTRFNVLVGYAKNADSRLAPEWLASRFQPFDAFCYPSVRAQRAPFRWLVFFDAATPLEFRKRIAEYEVLTPIFVDGALTDQRIAEAVIDHVDLATTHLITTRLDSDDAIADDYLARVQAEFCGQEREFINFPFGYEWCGGRLYYRLAPSNAFMSLIERLPGGETLPSTVHCAPHDQLRRNGRGRQVWTRPMWLVSIHGRNNSSEQLGIRRLSQSIPNELRRQGSLSLVRDRWPSRLFDLGRSAGRLGSLPIRRRDRVAVLLRRRLENRT